MKLGVGLLLVALALAPLALACPVFADGDVAAADTAKAAREFAAGQKAFAAGDFRGAAALFDAAYRDAPHPSALWNEAHAWERAGEDVRAANLYSKYLAQTSASTPARASAEAALQGLAKRLARLDISAVGFLDVRVDDQPAEAASVYVAAGTHAIVARTTKGESVRRELAAEAGSTVAVALVAVAPVAVAPVAVAPAAVAPPAPMTPPAEAPLTPPPAAEAPKPASRGWSPTVVFVGAGVTAVGVLATILSGVNTVNWKKDHYDVDVQRSDTQAATDDLARGFARERRTNVILAITACAAVFTGASAIWLVDWHGPSGRVRVGFAPGTVTLGGEL